MTRRILNSKVQIIRLVADNVLATLTQADTNRHSLDLATALGDGRNITNVYAKSDRTVGTGNLLIWPHGGNLSVGSSTLAWHTIMDNALSYSLTIANDSFTLYCLAYTVEV